MRNGRALTLMIATVLISGCAQSGSWSPTTSLAQKTHLTPAQMNLVGSWAVSTATCNGNAVTANYVPPNGQLLYHFDGYTLIQARSGAGGCTQSIAMPYTFDGTAVTVSTGFNDSMTCAPGACTDAGLMPASACGTSAPITTSEVSVVSFSGNPIVGLSSSENDPQATSICTQYGQTAPFAITMTKQ
jgi:hypothetical protein